MIINLPLTHHFYCWYANEFPNHNAYMYIWHFYMHPFLFCPYELDMWGLCVHWLNTIITGIKEGASFLLVINYEDLSFNNLKPKYHSIRVWNMSLHLCWTLLTNTKNTYTPQLTVNLPSFHVYKLLNFCIMVTLPPLPFRSSLLHSYKMCAIKFLNVIIYLFCFRETDAHAFWRGIPHYLFQASFNARIDHFYFGVLGTTHGNEL